MEYKQLVQGVAVAGQLTPEDLPALKARGIKTLICNRPDGEAPDQPDFAELRAAASDQGMLAYYLPIAPGHFSVDDATAMGELIASSPGGVLAFCRTGTRSTTLWAMHQVLTGAEKSTVVAQAGAAGYDVSKVLEPLALGRASATELTSEIVIVGGGSAGIAVAASLLARDPDAQIALVEPADVHYYQPGWTLVGAGVFTPEQTRHSMQSVMPSKVNWLQTSVSHFDPDNNSVILTDGRRLGYQHLIVAAGLELNWGAIEGLEDTLGKTA